MEAARSSWFDRRNDPIVIVPRELSGERNRSKVCFEELVLVLFWNHLFAVRLLGTIIETPVNKHSSQKDAQKLTDDTHNFGGYILENNLHITFMVYWGVPQETVGK